MSVQQRGISITLELLDGRTGLHLTRNVRIPRALLREAMDPAALVKAHVVDASMVFWETAVLAGFLDEEPAP